MSIVRELDDAQARGVVERLLGQARELTHPELGGGREKEAAAVDPGWHEARRAAAVARARVIARSAPSGAAELSGLDLPEDLALEAHGHVVALADAVRAAVRARGGDVGQGFTEAHVYLALLRPHLLGADDATVVASLTEELLHPHTPGDRDGGSTPTAPTTVAPTTGPRRRWPRRRGPDDGGPDDGGPDDGGPDDGGPEDEPDEAAPDEHMPDAGPESPPDSTPLAFRAGVAVRLELTTLLGLDRHPGEVPDYGIVAGSTARHLARTRPGATVRLLLYDPDGHLEYTLTLHPRGGPGRPTSQPPPTTNRGGPRVDRHVGRAGSARPARTRGDPARPRAGSAGRGTRSARQQHPARTTADAHRRHPGVDLEA